MWWKLSVLAVTTTALIFLVIPPQTHMVRVDPSNPPPRPKFWEVIGSLHITGLSELLIVTTLAIAVFIGVKIVRAL